SVVGLMPLFAGERSDTLDLPDASGEIHTRTALLFPVYHEDCATIAGTVEAIVDDLAALGKTSSFEVFILSDSRSAEAGQREEAVFAALAHRLSDQMPVYYRRRRENTAKKSGNIADWIERFGAGYDHFIVF